ncbi:MAG: class I SAM-dependent methyltransferase [Acidimicrobiia bacterium]|nr:class I SAM-dependent methyltransferase [Acidimicrobiia bacterium]
MEAWGPSTYGDAWADVYDDLYRPDEEAVAACVAFVVEQLEDCPAGDVLELGIGTGRIALPLAEVLPSGVTLHGIDCSEPMLERLAAKPGSETIVVHRGDFGVAAAFDRGLHGAFALVLCPFATFFALPDSEAQITAFRNVAELLRPGGVFCLEAFVPDHARLHEEQSVLAVDVAADHVLLGASQYDRVTQTIESQSIRIGEDGIRLLPVRVRYAWPAELDLMARLAGLEPKGRYADWRRSVFSADATRHVSVYRSP